MMLALVDGWMMLVMILLTKNEIRVPSMPVYTG